MVYRAPSTSFHAPRQTGRFDKHDGDIDNRLLFDSLKMPQTTDELPDTAPGAGEDPFFA